MDTPRTSIVTTANKAHARPVTLKSGTKAAVNPTTGGNTKAKNTMHSLDGAHANKASRSMY